MPKTGLSLIIPQSDKGPVNAPGYGTVSQFIQICRETDPDKKEQLWEEAQKRYREKMATLKSNLCDDEDEWTG